MPFRKQRMMVVLKARKHRHQNHQDWNQANQLQQSGGSHKNLAIIPSISSKWRILKTIMQPVLTTYHSFLNQLIV
eukprot:12689872-Ditylum_brightwellii.AAC.1